MRFQQLFKQIKPRQLFLIDSLGALLSAFLLGIVLTRYEATFGMPRNMLYPLAIIACFFSVYSFVCFVCKLNNWRPFLKAIAIVNLLYCFLTAVLLVVEYAQLTGWGIGYFVAEIAIVTSLALIELRIASHVNA